jgi:hypothetical protein
LRCFWRDFLVERLEAGGTQEGPRTVSRLRASCSIRVSIWSFSGAFRSGGRVRCGSSPRSLSSITDIWRPTPPVECCWLSVPRRCGGLQERLQSVPASQRGQPAVSPPRTVSGETSQPGFPRTCRCVLSEPGPDAFEIGCIRSDLPQVGTGVLADPVVGLGRRVLSLTPQVTFLVLMRPTSCWEAYRASDFIAPPWSSPGFPAPPWRSAQSAAS